MDAPTKSSRPSDGQRALAEQLARGEAALGTGTIELDAGTYTDPQRFEAERRRLFERLPLVVAPSALIAQPNRRKGSSVRTTPGPTGPTARCSHCPAPTVSRASTNPTRRWSPFRRWRAAG